MCKHQAQRLALCSLILFLQKSNSIHTHTHTFWNPGLSWVEVLTPYWQGREAVPELRARKTEGKRDTHVPSGTYKARPLCKSTSGATLLHSSCHQKLTPSQCSLLRFINICSLIQQIFMEFVAYARYCARYWRHNDEQDRHQPCPPGT